MTKPTKKEIEKVLLWLSGRLLKLLFFVNGVGWVIWSIYHNHTPVFLMGVVSIFASLSLFD